MRMKPFEQGNRGRVETSQAENENLRPAVMMPAIPKKYQFEPMRKSSQIAARSLARLI